MSASAPITASAPGRVNLIGEHTDYNGGFVLPTAIPHHTQVDLRPRADQQVTAHSANAQPDATYRLGGERPQQQWFDYVQGITWALAQAGHALQHGFDLDIRSTVPLGGGLSSSASLEVALLRAIRQAFSLTIDDVQLARFGQIAENDFVGARCGIMDQMSASLADAHNALFLDTRSLDFERVPLPKEADLVVIHSGVTHRIAEGHGVQSEYNARRADCEQAAAQLGVPQLRDLTSADLPRLAALSDRLHKRARHVITEDERVLAAVSALKAQDVVQLGTLFYASHASMRDDFEVSTPEIDLLVNLAQQDPAIYGARLTGGGFGGAVVVLTRGGVGRAVGQRLARAYSDQSGQSPTVLVPTP